jgi:hypothetical protein
VSSPRRSGPLLGVTAGGLAAVLVAAALAAVSLTPEQRVEAAPPSDPPRAREPVRQPLPPPPVEEPVPAAAPERVQYPELGPPPGPQHDVRPERVAAPQDRYAFLVGVQDYRPPTKDTIASANDVRFIAGQLVANGWRPENIRVVTDAQATGAAIRSGMAWLAQQARPGTFSLFHYSGHVKQHGGGHESLWPVDRDWVDDRAVASAMAKVGGKVWVDIAGCEAGSFEPGIPSERVLFTASSTGTQKSYEHPDWGLSVWTGLLFDLGTRQRGADADGNGRVTMGEALRYSTYYAQVVTLDQRPHGRQTPQVAGDPVLGWTLADPPA